MSSRLLVLLPQLPDDPASGAARTVTTIASMMAQAGFEVELIATTANEGQRAQGLAEAVAHLGVDASPKSGLARFTRRGVAYTLIETGQHGVAAAVYSSAATYDKLVDEALARFRPTVALTFGGSRLEVERQRRIRRAGVKVVFGLYNMRYFSAGFFDHVDAVITPSHWLTRRYRTAVGLESVPLLGPLWPDDVLATGRMASRVTIVNPTLDKGLMVFAAIARLMARQHPGIAIDVFTSRDSDLALHQAAFLGGADLGRLGIRVRPSAWSPAAIYEQARIVLVPSLFEDPAPRVIAEAFLNGAVPIGSDRGGIPEMCAEAGFVVPIPRTVNEASFNYVSDDVAQPWVDRIASLVVDEGLFLDAVTRGRVAARAYLPGILAPAYGELFESLARIGS